MDDLDLALGMALLHAVDPASRGRVVYCATPIRSHRGVDVFFYELHEGDNEVYSDVLVVSESEWEPEEFFELVQSIRRRIQDNYEPRYARRSHRRRARTRPWLHLRQRRPARGGGQRLDRGRGQLPRRSRGRLADAEEDDDDDDDEETASVDYRSILADIDLGGGR